MRASARRRADAPIRDRRRHAALALLLVATLAIGCETSVTPADRRATDSAAPAAAAASASLAASAASLPVPSPSASASASLAPPNVPTAPPSVRPRPDPARFGFAAKGLKGEVMAFVTTSQVDDALARLDFGAVSTIAYFSLEASSTGTIRQDTRWRSWTSKPVDELIARAHATGTKVVISLARFSWSGSQWETSVKLLSNAAARARLATSVADEVVRRGVDGVNVDFEPIPTGQKASFTDLVRRIRAALDARGPGYQLTFDVVGHFDSYDVGGALRPGGADAVYLMGYHFAGTFSTVAHGTAPLDGPGYSVGDAIRLLRKVARSDQIIVGVPYYGHVWPTATADLRARTTGRGSDVTYDRARLIAAAHPTSYDPAEEVRRVVWRQRDCASCPLHWVQLYFDDPRSLAAKWGEFQRQKLLGTGIWTVAFEGESGQLTAALRRAWLVGG
jgi:spore germination protein YaaH